MSDFHLNYHHFATLQIVMQYFTYTMDSLKYGKHKNSSSRASRTEKVALEGLLVTGTRVHCHFGLRNQPKNGSFAAKRLLPTKIGLKSKDTLGSSRK